MIVVEHIYTNTIVVDYRLELYSDNSIILFD